MKSQYAGGIACKIRSIYRHEVGSALNRNEPVVALESSVIAQGLPAGVNVGTALEMEEAVREAGALPATVGVIDGKIRIGLTREEIERLGEGKASKLAVRDLPYAVFAKLDGGTTVSATARIAAASGLSVMATGGIGGVHRGFAQSLDISADLWELARTPIFVVCSGVKAVLDARATLEWLETHSVPVYGWETGTMPGVLLAFERSIGPQDHRFRSVRNRQARERGFWNSLRGGDRGPYPRSR